MSKKIEEASDVKSFDDLVELFQNEFKRPLTSTELGKLSYLVDKVGLQYTIHALREAVIYRVYRFQYIETIILSWVKDGLKLEDLNEGKHRDINRGFSK